MNVTTGASVGKKAKDTTKVSKKQTKNRRLLWIPLIAVGVVILLVGVVISYKKARYAAAPAEIKLIRTLPIYNYESANLKIISRSEDYGGYDWKHVYNEPYVYLYFMERAGGYFECRDELLNKLQGSMLEITSDYSVLGETEKRALSGTLVYGNRHYDLDIEPNNRHGATCSIRIVYRQ